MGWCRWSPLPPPRPWLPCLMAVGEAISLLHEATQIGGGALVPWWPSCALTACGGDDVLLQKFQAKALLDVYVTPTSAALSWHYFSSMEALL